MNRNTCICIPTVNAHVCCTDFPVVSQNDEREVYFDVETAVRVCRSAGYFEQALALTRKHKQHNSHLKILLEDTKDFHKALEYMATLEFEQVRTTTRYLIEKTITFL